MAIEIRLLGRFCISKGGQELPAGAFGGRLSRKLIRLLVTKRGSFVPSDILAEALWPGEQPADPPTNVRVLVNRARKALGEASLIQTGPGGYCFAGEDSCLVDAEAFLARVEAGRQRLRAAEEGPALREFQSALGAWGGEPLAEDAYEDWAQAYRGMLMSAHLEALEGAAQAALALGDPGQAAALAERAVAREPLRGRAHLLRIESLAVSGDTAAALAAYEKFRRALAEDLGLDPSPEALQLEACILRGEVPMAALSRAPEIFSPRQTRHNLPTRLTSFIGRQQELAEIRKLTRSERLVTLTGAGGCGKTRLALEVAEELVDEFPDGVWMADLAPLADAGLVPATVASALDLRQDPDREAIETVVRYLRPRSLLLVLDNCEHLVASCARLVEQLLKACPGLHVLATSREPLGAEGEFAWRVPSLSVPDPAHAPSLEALAEYESVQLFLDRAKAANAGLPVRNEDSEALAKICGRLDGIPLAIELAAARAGMLSVGDIADRLEDRFRLLTSRAPTTVPRHRTLKAAIDWSYDLLDASQKILLARLSVFSGGFTVEAAEAVCSRPGVEATEVLDLLGELVTKSLVLMDAAPGKSRYRMLETVRQYGAEKLAETGEANGVARRHLELYLEMAEHSERDALGADGGPVLDRLEAEADNFRASLRWSLEAPQEEEALRLAHALFPFWEVRDRRREGRGWLQAALARAGDGFPLASAVARRAGVLAWETGDLEAAEALLQQGLAIARKHDDPSHLALALTNLGKWAVARGNLAGAVRLLTEGLGTASEVRDAFSIEMALLWLGWAAHHEARYDEARAWAGRCQEACEGRWFHLARAFYLLSWVEREQGNYPEARLCLEECRSLAASAGEAEFEAEVLEGLGGVAAAEGKISDARAAYEQALAVASGLQSQVHVGPLRGLGELALNDGDHHRARVLLEEALDQARRLGFVFLEVPALIQLGRLASAEGSHVEAANAYHEALAIAERAKMPFLLASCLEAVASLVVKARGYETGAILLGSVESLREAIGAPRPPAALAGHDEQVTMITAGLPEGIDAAWRDGRSMLLQTVIALGLRVTQQGSVMSA